MRYFINLSYLGTHYSGWQRQTIAPSLQETIESALSALLKQETRLIGCGRTDAGVHAYNYVAHFNGSELINNLEAFLYKINRMIPVDIRIHTIEPINYNLHAQHNAINRTYRYYFHLKANPFIDHLSTRIFVNRLNTINLVRALNIIPQYQDFVAFCKQPLQYPNTLCNLNTAKLYTNISNDRFYFEFSANRFLRSMVRIIVHRLLLIGENKLDLNDFEDYFISKPLLNANEFAYPQGLVLYQVEYENTVFKKQVVYTMDRGLKWTELKNP